MDLGSSAEDIVASALTRATGAAAARELMSSLKTACRKDMAHDVVLGIEELMATHYKSFKSEQIALGKAIGVVHDRIPVNGVTA